jgi:hypothetical protein
MSIPPEKQNRGAVIAPVSRNQLGGWLQVSITAQERQAQILTSRFCLSPSMARELAKLCFGEAAND